MRFEPVIRREEAEEGFWGWELGGALIEELVEVAGADEGLAAGALVELVELAIVLLELDVRRGLMRMSKPCWMPNMDLVSNQSAICWRARRQSRLSTLLGQGRAEFFVLLVALAFGGAGIGMEVLFAVGGQLELLDGRVWAGSSC